MYDSLPTQWIKSGLGDICQIKTGKRDANHAVPNGKYRFYTCAYDHLSCNTKSFSGECLILPGNGANVGEVFFFNGEFEAYQRTYVLEQIKLYPKFLYYHMLLYWRIVNEDKQFGSATNYIRMNNFLNYEVHHPPLDEQKKIVEKIEQLFSELDSGVAALKKAKEQIKLYRQSVLSAAFSGRLTGAERLNGMQEVSGSNKNKYTPTEKDTLIAAEPDATYTTNLPEGWKWVKVEDICDKIIGGGTPSTKVPDFWSGDIAWITSADIYGTKEIRPRKKITKQAIQSSATNLLPKGNIIVVTRVGLGKLATNDFDLCFSQDSQGLVLNKEIVDKEYTLWYLSNAVQIFKVQNRGTTINGVTKKQLAELAFVLPPIDIQRLIASEIEKRFAEADNMEKTIDESLAKAEALKQSILKQAFEGKLV